MCTHIGIVLIANVTIYCCCYTNMVSFSVPRPTISEIVRSPRTPMPKPVVVPCTPPCVGPAALTPSKRPAVQEEDSMEWESQQSEVGGPPPTLTLADMLNTTQTAVDNMIKALQEIITGTLSSSRIWKLGLPRTTSSARR